MIRKLFNQPHVLYQTSDEVGIYNDPIAVHVDSGGTIVLTQQDADICIDAASVPELCRLLKKLAEGKS